MLCCLLHSGCSLPETCVSGKATCGKGDAEHSLASPELWLEPDSADRSDWLIRISFNPRLLLAYNLYLSIAVIVVLYQLFVT